MNKILISLVAILAACAGRPPSGAVDTQLSEVQRAATVALHVTCINGPQVEEWRGSGVIVGEFDILTAAHVTSCPGLVIIDVETLGHDVMFALVVWEIEEYDIAKIRTGESLPPARFTLAPAPPVDAVVCTESAVPLRSRACGLVHDDDSWSRDPGGDVMHDAITVPGNSGSGAFDSQGRLVGIVTLSLTKGRRYMGGAISSLWQWRDCVDRDQCDNSSRQIEPEQGAADRASRHLRSARF